MIWKSYNKYLEKENKMKSKKVLTILLSLAIMVTFMPTFAFADSTYWNAGKWLVEPEKCGDYGVWQQECTYGTNDTGYEEVKCTDVLNTATPKAHKAVKDIMTPAAFVEKLMAQGYFAVDSASATDEAAAAKQAADVAKYLSANNCQLEVYVCDSCGKLVKQNGTDIGKTSANDKTADANYEKAIVNKVAHVASVPCAKVPTCKNCGGQMATSTATTDHASYKNADGTPKDGFTMAESNRLCGNAVAKKVYTHDKCGEVVSSEYTTSGTATHNYGAAVSGVSETATGAEAYIWVSGKAYNPNMTRLGNDNKNYNMLVCEECGLPVDKNDVTVKTGQQTVTVNGYKLNTNNVQTVAIVTPVTCAHNWNTVKVDASCDNPEMSFDICTVCNEYRNVTSKAGTQLKHNYTEKVLSQADCTNNGITIMECSTCGHQELVGATNTTKRNGKYFFIYANGEVNPATGAVGPKYIEIADWHGPDPLGHSWGSYESVAEATCEHSALQAKKCKVCGAYDAHSVKETGKELGHTIEEVVVPATCGAKGYTYNFCVTCEKYALKGVKTGDTTHLTANELTNTYKYDWTDPKVKIGAECNFEWKVTKAATETADGEKALVCSVCGAVKDGSQTVIPADVATAEKKAAAEAAIPAIEAAAEILNNSSKYTDDSVAKIEEARTMLNQAIASGTAADVKAMTELVQQATAAVVEKSANTMTAKGKTVTASAKKNKTFKKAKAFTVKNAKGSVTFKKASGDSKITVSKAGKVTVKKGLKKGKTYKVKVNVTAAGNGNYKAKTTKVTLKVKVK
jgi:hypothetical protein